MKSKVNRDKPRRITFVTGLQTLYLTLAFFFSNDLLTYASACAFGFLFSFVPVVMMILAILIRVLHASPETLSVVFGGNGADFLSLVPLEGIVSSIEQMRHITNFEIVIGIAIILMARRFFSSLVGSLNKIFRQVVSPRPFMTQLLILAVEAVLVIIISAIIFVAVFFRAMVSLPIFEGFTNMFPLVFTTFTKRAVSITPLFILFIIVAFCYKAASRAHPSIKKCMLSAGMCVATFILFQKLMSIFININRYNFIYGVLSNTIVLLMEVFFFFVIFLFFAQFLFVNQFFDTLLFSELYLLPEYEDTNFFASAKRLLFIRPDALLRQTTNVIFCKKGEVVYSRGERGDCAYYIVHGIVEVRRRNNITFKNRGSFFGTESLMLNGIRAEEAVAHTACRLIKISEEAFFNIVEKNPRVSMKALSQISTYFARFYSRLGDSLL